MNTLIVIRCIRTEAGIHRLSPSSPPPPLLPRLLNVFERISAVIFIAERYGPGQPFSGWDMTRTSNKVLRLPYSPRLCRGKLRDTGRGILENWRSGGVEVACSGNWCSSCSHRNCLVLSGNLPDARRESSALRMCENGGKGNGGNRGKSVKISRVKFYC